MNWIRKNWLSGIIALSVFVAAGAVFYYFVMFLPEQSRIKDAESTNLNELQEQLISAKAELEKEKNKIEEPVQIPANKPQPKAQVVQQDSTIKIEVCKTQAKDYADKRAKREYLLAMEKAAAAGDSKTALFYLNLSDGPAHPADYDSNYNGEYIKCLNN